MAGEYDRRPRTTQPPYGSQRRDGAVSRTTTPSPAGMPLPGFDRRRPPLTTPPPDDREGNEFNEGAGGSDGGQDTYGYCCIREISDVANLPDSYRCIRTYKGHCSRLNQFPHLQTIFSIWPNLCNICNQNAQNGGGGGGQGGGAGAGAGQSGGFVDIDPDVFARDRINEIFRDALLERINYDEPLDICDCDPYLTPPPDPPTVPRRREPPRPPRPPVPPILPPPLPPPPVRFVAPQIGSVAPVITQPPGPPVVPPAPPVIGDDGEEGGGGDDGGGDGGTSTPPTTRPPDDDGFEPGPVCCLGGVGGWTDADIEAAGQESIVGSGAFGVGCFSMCDNKSLSIYRLYGGDINMCNFTGIQICYCSARNNPSSPCYVGNQVARPGGNITMTSSFRTLQLPSEFGNEQEYYASGG
jgi:hypothetical protein